MIEHNKLIYILNIEKRKFKFRIYELILIHLNSDIDFVFCEENIKIWWLMKGKLDKI